MAGSDSATALSSDEWSRRELYPNRAYLGLTVGDLKFVSCLTARESADTWKRFTGEKRRSALWCDCAARPDGVWKMFDRSYGRTTKTGRIVQVGLDGVMMRMIAEVIEEEGWREACGVVTVRERETGYRAVTA